MKPCGVINGSLMSFSLGSKRSFNDSFLLPKVLAILDESLLLGILSLTVARLTFDDGIELTDMKEQSSSSSNSAFADYVARFAVKKLRLLDLYWL